jgi:hypothetical protein
MIEFARCCRSWAGAPLLAAAVSLGCAAGPAAAQVTINGTEYIRMETRAATEALFHSKVAGTSDIIWGPYWLLSPFPGREKGTLPLPLDPERELERMAAGGPGPDLAATYAGKNQAVVAWRRMPEEDFADNRTIDLRVHGDRDLDDEATCYLYRTITCTKPAAVVVTMGSDDGLRFWLNGELLVDADEPRGLNPDAHKVRLALKPGVNHFLAKISQGRGAWNFQINNRLPLDSMTDALLQHQLNTDFPSAEQQFYRVTTIPVPDGIVLEVGGLDVRPDGRAMVCTRRGDVFIVSDYQDAPASAAAFSLFASGLHEPLGLQVRREPGAGKAGLAVYCVQRGELTRLVDVDGDDRADRYETVCDAWGLSGNYHEFAFGPKFDQSGLAWITLNVGFCGSLGKSVAPYRGWAVTVDTRTGAMTPVCDGLRSPNGIGMWLDGAMFYADNQGDYVGTNRLSLLAPGSYAGHPAGLSWRPGWTEGQEPPARQPAAIWFPYKKMGQSVADWLLDTTGGRFGPFENQVFVGDQTLATVMRVDLEKIPGTDGEPAVYQGACFPFFSGLDCGVNRLAWDTRGGMLIGQTDRGWASIGRRRFGLQRLAWTGRTPFEVLTMRAQPDGFLLTFTRDLDPDAAANPASYSMKSYTYEYHPEYGSAEMGTRTLTISRVAPAGARSVRLVVEGLRDGGEGFVHELLLPGVRDLDGEPLLHPQAYYTLQRIPGRGPAGN